MEKTNVRYITNDDVAEQSDFASIDVSFISLTKVLPAVFAVLKQKAKLVCLIKPQFEAGREKVAKKGVVKGIKKGRCKITIKCNGVKKVIKVKVK